MSNTKAADYVGKTFGRLTVLSIASRNRFGQTLFNCRCDCSETVSNNILININNLKSGDTKSCGCLWAETRPKSSDPYIAEFNYFKNNNKKRDLEIAFSKEEFEALCRAHCTYCGHEPATKMHVGKAFRNGIDRVDNEKGYSVDNCVTCCSICNNAKRCLTIEQFREWIQRIIQHNQ
jgi:hypothetical protein